MIIEVGIYFAIMMAILHISMLLGFPKLSNTQSIRKRKGMRIITFLAMEIFFFLLASLCQLIYSMNYMQKNSVECNNYCFLIDISGSTKQTDPQNERYQAVINILDILPGDSNVSILVFNDKSKIILENENNNNQIQEQMQKILPEFESDGGTDIELALQKAMNIQEKSKGNIEIVLLSDGESNIHFWQILPELKRHVARVDAVVFPNMGFGGINVLKKLTSGTGGILYQVDDVQLIQDAITKVLYVEGKRNLLGVDPTNGGWFISIFRVISYMMLGWSECLTLAMLYDNRYIYKRLRLCCLLTGILAGFAQELISNYCYMEREARFCMCIMMCLLVLCEAENPISGRISKMIDRTQNCGNADKSLNSNYSRRDNELCSEKSDEKLMESYLGRNDDAIK